MRLLVYGFELEGLGSKRRHLWSYCTFCRGFGYSWSPKGKVVGTVGTGFSREKRIDMLTNPDKYIGNVARVKSPQKYESGALRSPAFYSIDVEKNLKSIKQASFIGELKKIAGGIDSAEDDISTYYGSEDTTSVNAGGGFVNTFKYPSRAVFTPLPQDPYINRENASE